MKQHNAYGVAFTVSLIIGSLGANPALATDDNQDSESFSFGHGADLNLIAPAFFDLICEDLKDNQRQLCEDTCRSIEATPEFEEGFCGFGSVCQCADKGTQTP